MVLAFVIQNRSYGVAFSVVHAETSGAASEAVALGSEVLAVAGVAEHLAVMLADAAGVQELLAVGTIVGVLCLLKIKSGCVEAMKNVP